MLRSLIFVILSAALCMGQTHHRGGATPAKSTSVPSVQQTIFELEQRWLQALVQRDQATVASILAPEFHDTTMTGEVHDRQQALAAVLDTTRPDFQRSFGRLDVQAYDARFAVARGIVLISGPHIHPAQIAFTDVFILKDGKWQAVAAQEALVQKQ